MSRQARRFPNALGAASLAMAERPGVAPAGDLEVAAGSLAADVPARCTLARARSRTRLTRHWQLAALRPIEGIVSRRDAKCVTAKPV
jgi:hypothetical protein